MWYKLQACRAVNQAIGRVIRHVDDYGAIILMDERYKSHNIEISKWLNVRKRVYSFLAELEGDLEVFFKKNGCKETNSTIDKLGFRKASNKISRTHLRMVNEPEKSA